uniref:TIR domain-containing protein n=1 Tax=Strigamia maritima TaxID=126957 RepID=T1ITN8_STRMM
MLRLCLCLHLVLLTLAVTHQYLNPHNRCREKLGEGSTFTYQAYCVRNNFQGLEYLHPNTTKLTIGKNNVKVLTGAPFRNLSNLLSLNLRGNKLNEVKNDSFEGLNKLQQLVLKDNMIKSIDQDLFNFCPLLQSIDFSSNFVIRLTSFAKAMAPLTQLNHISFADNVMLETITENDLRPLNKTNVTLLNLEQCQLRNIGRGALSHLHKLKYLFLSTNPLADEQIANAVYNISPELIALHIHSMTLTEIPSKTLQTLTTTNIRSLNMKNNRFRSIKQGIIPPVKSLRILNLRQCDIEDLIGVMFANLTSLEELDLSFNRIMGITSAIYTLKSLKILDMNNNQDHRKLYVRFDLGGKKLSQMVNLETLYLNDLRIGFLSRYDLYGLTNLKSLYLKNSLDEIEEFSFETLRNLDKLILTGSTISAISSNILAGLTNVTYLDLVNTGLSLEPNDLHFHHTPNLQILNLAYNKLNLIPLRDIEVLNKLDLLILRNNAIIPWHDPIAYGKNVRSSTIDLKENNLDQITPAMIRDFSLFHTVDISLNPYNCSKCVMYDFARWLNSTNITVNNENYIQCKNPKNMRDMPVSKVALYDYCIVDRITQIIAISTSLSVIGAVFIAGAIVGYRFRWYFRYYWFLTRARVKRMKSVSVAHAFQYDAFISYNAHDQDWMITNLLPKLELEEPKFKICLHERDFVIGKEIISNIVESIDNSRYIVLLLSNNFLASQWCTWEMNMAQFMSVDGCRDALILIMIEPIKRKSMSSTLKYLIKTRTYLEWTDNAQGQKLFWERLKFAMQRPDYQAQQPNTIKLV